MTFDKPTHALDDSPHKFGTADQIAIAAPRQLCEGEIIAGRYQIVSLIGQGAMGSVYVVDQVLLKKRLAMKTLNPIAATDIVLRRFHNEAQTMSRLDHPNIVGSIDFGLIDNNQPFMVMDYVEGQSLSQVLKAKGRLSVEMALQIFIPICFAIGYAHQEGVVHRDIKPGNIMLAKSDSIATDFIPKIVDFGISKLASADDVQALTRTGEIFGTPLYMSPEQCTGAKIDKRSDIYSLGCVIYEALTGSPPFVAATALETMMQHSTAPLSTMKDASLGQNFPASLENMIAKMLAKEPRDRYQSCLDVAEDFIRFQSNPLAVSVGKIVAENANSSKSNFPKIIWSALAACTIFGVLGYAWYAGGQRQPAKKAAAVDVVDAERNRRLQDKTTVEETSILSTDQAMERPAFVPKSDTFSTVVAGSPDVTFKFPPTQSLGHIMYWDSQGQRVMKNAAGTAVFPLTTKRIFIPNLTLLESPIYAQYFSNDDFSGLVLDYSFSERESLDKTNEALTRLDGLRAMCMIKSPIASDSVVHIGSLPNLTWLLSKKSIDPLKIANFSRLQQLKVLAVPDYKNVRPLLQKLSGSSALKRLSLANTDIVPEDIALLVRCRALTHLNLVNTFRRRDPVLTDTNREKCMAQLAKLPDLKYLAVGLLLGAPTKLTPAVLRHLSEMKKLEVLYLELNLSAEDTAQIQKYLSPHCRIVTWTQTDNPERWFDPRYVNPDVDDLW